ncbi:Sec-independent protein translocase protein TatB [soil metagenome]
MGGLGPGIGGSEWFIIGLVALVVVGPERLPGLLRQLGKWVAKARGMANEFRSSFDEMARQSELDDLRKEVEALRTGQPVRLGAEAQAAFQDIRSEFDNLGKSSPVTASDPAPAMIQAPSEWPDGEPVMLPLSEPPLVSVGHETAEAVPAPRKRAVAVKSSVKSADTASDNAASDNAAPAKTRVAKPKAARSVAVAVAAPSPAKASKAPKAAQPVRKTASKAGTASKESLGAKSGATRRAKAKTTT